MGSVWEVPPLQWAHAQKLAVALRLHPLTGQLLLNRKITSAAAARRYLTPSVEALSELEAFRQLPGVVARLQQAAANRERVLIFSDSDVDGLTAGVILYEVLEALGVPVEARIANRIADGYGLAASFVQQLTRAHAALLILVDCGTNQPEALRALRARGIDTLVIDHHVPLESFPADIPIFNPRLIAGTGQEMCSAGLAFTVARALLGESRLELWRSWVELAALGTLADCSPLVADNRVIVAEGLPRLVATQRPGLAALCRATKATRPEPEHVLRQLTPRLNACGRMGEARAIWQLLRQRPDGDVAAWLQEAAAAHALTKSLYRETMAEAQAQVHRLHFRDQRVLVVARSGWHQGIMGPLAAQLAQQYGRPAIAIALNEEQGVGSGRSPGGTNLLELLRGCEETLVRFGGHAAACGLTVTRAQLETFRQRVNAQAQAAPAPGAHPATRWVDVELPLAEVTAEWVQEATRLSPFGIGNPKPTVLLRQVQFTVRSPRMGLIRQGAMTCPARGNFEGLAEGEAYDAVVSPSVVMGQLQLAVGGVKGAGEPWARGQT